MKWDQRFEASSGANIRKRQRTVISIDRLPSALDSEIPSKSLVFAQPCHRCAAAADPLSKGAP